MAHVNRIFGIVVLLLLTVKALADDAIEVCPSRQIYASNGEVISQTEPNYANGVDCQLEIIGDPGMFFKVELTKLSIERDPDALGSPEVLRRSCKNSAVNINGNVRCYTYSFFDEPEKFETTSNRLVIHFYTEKALVENRQYTEGFTLSFSTQKKQVPIGQSICSPPPHIMKNRSGTIISPGFQAGNTGNYGNNQNCRIKIPIPDNFQLNVWFSHFFLQKSLSCTSDKLSIRDEHGGVKMCGGGPNKLPRFKQFTGSLANIHFKTDASLTNRGFALHYNMTRLTEGRCLCSTGSNYMCISNFNRKVRRAWHRIKFSVKTSQNSGLIIYSHKGNYRDYMYIAIKDGKIYYKSDLGTGPSMAVSHGMAINDNRWHYVEIRRKKRILRITVDKGKAVGSAKTQGDFGKIDLKKSLGYVLGTPPQLQGMPNFIGCIRDFTIDGREPLTNAYVAKPDYHGHGIVDMKKC